MAAQEKRPKPYLSECLKEDADLPVGKKPFAAVNGALEELKAGKVVSCLVPMPAE